MTENRDVLSDLSERVALLVREIEAGKAWGSVLLPLEHGDTCGATLNEAEEALCIVVDRVRVENERLNLALVSVWSFLRLEPGQNHKCHGLACGIDACILCLAEATAKQALQGSGSIDETNLPKET